MRLALILFIFIVLGCSNDSKNIDQFKLLPTVQNFTFNEGFSNLNHNNINYAFSNNNDQLPILYDFTNHISNSNKNEASIHYVINNDY